ncbi:hypothetical protein F4604DRAFT_1677020 [Suillus subluteus]|nr:hypothetical protein F4604DRAFT_1677020 [Suillus subluteus]
MANLLTHYDLEQFKWKPFKECWCWLHFQIPTVASFINESNHKLPMITYTTVSPQELSWSMRAKRRSLYQAWMHLVPGEIANGTVSKFRLLFHTHHTPFNDTGLKIVVNCYLMQLARVLSDSYSTSDSIEWGNKLENLPPAAYNILNSNELLPISPNSPEEPSFDHEYYKSLGSVLTSFSVVVKDMYGFRACLKDTEWPKTHHAEVLLTREESGGILTALKISGFTLTYLASSSHYLNNVSLANLRGWLDSKYSLHSGYILGVSMTRIPVNMLLKVADIAKEQYRAHMELPAALSCMPQVGKAFASAIVPAVTANMYMWSTNHLHLFISWQAATQSVLLIFQ